MPFPKADAGSYESPLVRYAAHLATLTEDTRPVDIVTFAEHEDYLGQTLYPRQRLLLKLLYRLPLTHYPCWCLSHGGVSGECNHCGGRGIYDELEDVKRLLASQDVWGAPNKYARLCMPGLCAHHVTGSCERELCNKEGHESEALYRSLTGYERKDDLRILSDTELRERLLSHTTHILIDIAGRRGGKSAEGAVGNVYGIYELLNIADPAAHWGLLPNQEIKTANTAAEEIQAQDLFKQMKGLIDNSPWFKRFRYEFLEKEIRFPGRNIIARSYHSSGISVRGGTCFFKNFDEFCHINGSQSDKELWAGLEPAGAMFGGRSKTVISSSPGLQAGLCWDLCDGAMRGTQNVIYAQLASWEHNPRMSRDDPECKLFYEIDYAYGEQEYGAQWTGSAGVFLSHDAVHGCAKEERGPLYRADPRIKYQLHGDLSKNRDKSGLIVTHWDPTLHKVIVDLIYEIDPTDENSEQVTNGEVDVDAVYDYIVDELYTARGFRFNSITFDQFNSLTLIQRLRRRFADLKGDWIFELTFTEPVNRKLFLNLRSLITNAGIEYYRYSELLRQLVALRKHQKEGQKTWKVEAPPRGRDDLADALAAAAYRCLEVSNVLTSGIYTLTRDIEERDAARPPVPQKKLDFFERMRRKANLGSGVSAETAEPPVEEPQPRTDRKGRIIPAEVEDQDIEHSPTCNPFRGCVWDCEITQALLALKRKQR